VSLTPKERNENAGLTLDEHIFPDATYVRKIQLKVKSRDLQNPNEPIQVKIYAECMQHKGDRQTTSVTRTLFYNDGELIWLEGKKFDCINYDAVLEEVKKMHDKHIKENKNELVK
jgi:hypothetical protein